VGVVVRERARERRRGMWSSGLGRYGCEALRRF
jgi:endonuclease YncB( thermonuclease family)